MATPIPIKNIYYLLCYAWNRLDEGGLVDVSGMETAELADLYATVLINGTHRLLRVGLEQGYLDREEELAGVRGRVLLGTSARRLLLAHGKAVCTYDDLGHDTLPNRILKATIGTLSRVPSLDRKLRHKLFLLRRGFSGVSDIRLDRLVFRRVQLHGNNRFYRFLLSICELVASSWLVDQQAGIYRFRDFIRDEKRMAKLFESFVMNFYRIERPDLDVRRERIRWAVTGGGEQALQHLPVMRTDVSIRHGDCMLIIDTKFYRDLFVTHHDIERFRAAHIYQLFAYIKNLETRGGAYAKVKGMLLYPVVDREVRYCIELHGHEFWICTIDLRKEWRELKNDMLELLDVVLAGRDSRSAIGA